MAFYTGFGTCEQSVLILRFLHDYKLWIDVLTDILIHDTLGNN